MNEILKIFNGDKVKADNLLNYFDGDELAASTWLKKYALKDSNGVSLEGTPDDMHKRMAKEFARIENSYIDKEIKMKKDEVYPFKKLSKYGQDRNNLTEKDIYNMFKDF